MQRQTQASAAFPIKTPTQLSVSSNFGGRNWPKTCTERKPDDFIVICFPKCRPTMVGIDRTHGWSCTSSKHDNRCDAKHWLHRSKSRSICPLRGQLVIHTAFALKGKRAVWLNNDFRSDHPEIRNCTRVFPLAQTQSQPKPRLPMELLLRSNWSCTPPQSLSHRSSKCFKGEPRNS